METGRSGVQRHPRVTAPLRVRLSTLDAVPDSRDGSPAFLTCEEVCGNVSRGGAFVRTAEPLAPGRRVMLEIALPGDRAVETIGRVAWSRSVLGSEASATDCGVGIEFIAAAPEHRAAIDRYVAGALAGRPRAPRPVPTRRPTPAAPGDSPPARGA